YRRKIALPQNSKSLQSGSNPSKRTLIVHGIILADKPSRLCHTAIRIARLRSRKRAERPVPNALGEGKCLYIRTVCSRGATFALSVVAPLSPVVSSAKH